MWGLVTNKIHISVWCMNTKLGKGLTQCNRFPNMTLWSSDQREVTRPFEKILSPLSQSFIAIKRGSLLTLVRIVVGLARVWINFSIVICLKKMSVKCSRGLTELWAEPCWGTWKIRPLTVQKAVHWLIIYSFFM